MSLKKRSRSVLERSDEESKHILLPVSKTDLDRNQGRALLDLKARLRRIEKATTSNRNYIDVGQTLTPGNTAAVGVLTPIPEGDTEQSRTGEKVTLRSIDMRITLIPNASALTDSMRVIVFRWKGDTVGSAPGASKILKSATNIDSPYNEDYRDQFVVLFDKTVAVSNAVGNKQMHLKRGLANATAVFNGALSTDWNANQVFFLFLATENTNKASINYYSRIHFLA